MALFGPSDVAKMETGVGLLVALALCIALAVGFVAGWYVHLYAVVGKGVAP